MIARRDVIRLITTSAVATRLPFALSAQDAQAALNEPMTFDVDIEPPPSLNSYNSPLPSATEFAQRTRRSLFAEEWSGFADGAPEEWAAYKQAIDRVIDLAPDLLGRPGITPLSSLDEAVVALAGTCWEAGVRVGAQMEVLRQALLRDTQICSRCNGHGRLTTFNTDAYRDAVCRVCQGAGTIRTVAV